MAAFAIAATISGITNWAIVTWQKHFTSFSEHFQNFGLFTVNVCLEILSAGWAKYDDAGFFYFYQARVDLLQTSCWPGLGQVWAWLSILLWNRSSIKRLSNTELSLPLWNRAFHKPRCTLQRQQWCLVESPSRWARSPRRGERLVARSHLPALDT